MALLHLKASEVLIETDERKISVECAIFRGTKMESSTFLVSRAIGYECGELAFQIPLCGGKLSFGNLLRLELLFL